MTTEISQESDYALMPSPTETVRVGGKVVPLNSEKLSSIDYKLQVLCNLFFGGMGLDDVYAGHYLKGFTTLTVAVCLFQLTKSASFFIGFFYSLINLITLSQGQYTDAQGKFIRQVVQLKKEEMSSCDQKTAIILCSTLGWLGAHQFYAGKPLKGVLMLCSIGGLGIWHAMNIYQLATCNFKDSQGKNICPDYIKQSAT